MLRVTTLMTRTMSSLAIERLSASMMAPQNVLYQTRNMGGGPRSQEQKERIRAMRRAAKAANRAMGPRPPKQINDPSDHAAYKALCEYKDKPIPKVLKDILPELEDFMRLQWLPGYPMGARLRKLQRDIAFRLPRKLRPGKLPYDQLMPMIGHFERKGILRCKAGSGGKLVIHDPNAEVFAEENALRALEEQREKEMLEQRENEDTSDPFRPLKDDERIVAANSPLNELGRPFKEPLPFDVDPLPAARSDELMESSHRGSGDAFPIPKDSLLRELGGPFVEPQGEDPPSHDPFRPIIGNASEDNPLKELGGPFADLEGESSQPKQRPMRASKAADENKDPFRPMVDDDEEIVGPFTVLPDDEAAALKKEMGA